MGHTREAFPLIRDLCTGVLEGKLSLESLRTAFPEDAYTDPFLGVVRGDLEKGISETPRSRFLSRVKRRAWYHSDLYGRIWFDRLLLNDRWRHFGTDELLGYREMQDLLVGIKASEEVVGAQLDLLEPATDDPEHLSRAAYTACRDFLVKHLREAIVAQENDRFLDIGDGYDELDESLPRNREPIFDKLLAGLYFWDEWSVAAEHDYHYDPPPEEWLSLAREVADRLERDEELPEHIIQAL
jgi:hypothetical protein